MIKSITNLFRKLHRDDEGLEALQVVMIVAVAAMLLIAVVTIGKWGTMGARMYASFLQQEYDLSEGNADDVEESVDPDTWKDYSLPPVGTK